MLDPFDYKEPPCSLCGGKEFYEPNASAPDGKIPVGRIIQRLDACFDRNNLDEARRLLEYWQNEGQQLRDQQGELSICNELVGLYRKLGEQAAALHAVERSLELLQKLSQEDTVSGATILLNCATAYKAFGLSQQAMPLYRRAEAGYRKLLPPEDSKFGGLYNNMALALVDLQQFEEAEAAYRSAISIMSKASGGAAEVAITYINLAHMYEAWNKPEKIAPCMAKADFYLKSPALVHNGYYAFVCEKCAPSFAYFGSQALADEYQRIAGELYERP